MKCKQIEKQIIFTLII